MVNKKQARIRRRSKTRAIIRQLGILSLKVHRTPRHIYAQIVDVVDGRVKVSASTLEKEFAKRYMGNMTGAKMIGELIAKRAKEAGIDRVAFDRGGFKYHGRIAALADAARDNGMAF